MLKINYPPAGSMQRAPLLRLLLGSIDIDVIGTESVEHCVSRFTLGHTEGDFLRVHRAHQFDRLIRRCDIDRDFLSVGAAEVDDEVPNGAVPMRVLFELDDGCDAFLWLAFNLDAHSRPHL
jgi:hypothetical protein